MLETLVKANKYSFFGLAFASLLLCLSFTQVALGQSLECNLYSIMYVGGACASTWGGGSIDAQITAAFNALPGPSGGIPGGGTIHILGQSGGYTFSNEIVLPPPPNYTYSKPVLLDLGGNTITCTVTSAPTCIQLNYGLSTADGGFNQPHGVVNGTLVYGNCVPGTTCATSTTQGIIFGYDIKPKNPVASIAVGPAFENLTLAGFAVAIAPANVNNNMWVQCSRMSQSHQTTWACNAARVHTRACRCTA